MELRKLLLTGVLLVIATGSAYGLSLTAKVDKTDATLEDQIFLTLSVEGSQRSARPQLPDHPAFEVMSRGSTTRMQIINGTISSGVDYTYILIPRKAGTFEIGPATLSDGGNTVESNTITLTIAAGESRQATAARQELFITAGVGNTNPYVNEQVIYTFKLLRSIRIANASLDSPSFQGFRVEPLGKEKEYETTINGKTYIVTEVRQALFPTREGTIEIEPAKLSCDVLIQSRRRSFFNDPFVDSFLGFSKSESKMLHSNPVTLEVQPLPLEGRTGLFSGLVGNFSLSTSLSKKQLEVGDTTTLTISIKGNGNIRDAAAPEMPSIPEFKIYDDKPVLSIQEGAELFGGTFTLKKALVPLQEGSLRVPELAFTYFDPGRGNYELCKSAPLTIEAAPPGNKEKLQLVEALGTITSKEEVKIIGRDILPINTSRAALRPYRLDPWHWMYLAYFTLPILGYAATALIKRRRKRLEEDAGYARGRGALKRFKRNISPVKKQAQTGDGDEFYRATSRALKEFLGDKLNITGSALTPREIEHQLSALSMPSDKIGELLEVLNALESGQFARRQLGTVEREKVLRETITLVSWLDKRIRPHEQR
jgi:hypothetical protein